MKTSSGTCHSHAKPNGLGRLEPESRVEGRVADDHDERAARFLELLGAGFDKTAADPLPLELRQHRHRAERRLRRFRRREPGCRECGRRCGRRGSRPVTAAPRRWLEGRRRCAFLLLAERAPVDSRGWPASRRAAPANHDHGTSRIVTRRPTRATAERTPAYVPRGSVGRSRGPISASPCVVYFTAIGLGHRVTEALASGRPRARARHRRP